MGQGAAYGVFLFWGYNGWDSHMTTSLHFFFFFPLSYLFAREANYSLYYSYLWSWPENSGRAFVLLLYVGFIYLNRRGKGELFHSVSGSADKKCQNFSMNFISSLTCSL
ncbi:hypothetical protein M441DRAFT_425712 [Trichoderma asperellum CBS 433.97]|uniref:Uncharacterized protein n=1 Tax=Trichoderma asperellum (strain ATCC 204424 / CBS 433.97 / NBRC 101777) TaxID=1042311 RepID=A0A2T3Z5H5_TRIA4|nr:hypothetical protein M441DRAFT_425712 [Trichoderma asperellum CBS 433.97]PTB40047.1 hypothetical protein M441DRAFT_425712 [Trichoderma asperellum CBS 433.97]